MSNGQLSIPHIDQYSVTINSPTIPVKVAGFPGPFQVINLNNSATIWLADNPVVKTGSGLPLNPGSSLTWTGSQGTKELWACLGTDSMSVGQSVGLIISDNVLGWQQNSLAIALALLNSGFILVDNPTTLAQPTGLNANTRFPTAGVYAVNNYQSLIIRYRIGGAAHTVQLTILWYSDSAGLQIIGQDQYNWVNTDTAPLDTNIPIRGAYMSAQLNIAAGNDDLVFVASNRVHNHWSSDMGSGNRVILSGNTAALVGGTISTFTPPIRYDGPCYMTCQLSGAAAAAVPLIALAIDSNTGFQIFGRRDPGNLDVGASRAYISGNFLVPRNSWAFQIFNAGATTLGASVEIIAAPEAT